MVMYLGSEKAGIRLTDYRDVPFRVGELMFDDRSFAPVKGKTNELFSCLFHRRFASPERAYSETTAWPPDKLSAPNMAAKLAVSTLSDVRNTMFMSGNTTFPRPHWPVLGEAMKKNAAIHRELAGHTPRGPFKHFWGEVSRYVADDNPYSLFLALGVPFEVASDLMGEGWAFLSNFDAKAVASREIPAGKAQLIHRPEAGIQIENGQAVEESLEAMFAWRREILPSLSQYPYVEQESAVVCGWYPTARAVLLWNLLEQEVDLTVRWHEEQHPVRLGALGIEILRDIG
jgi:hypothetical protein